MSTFRSLISQVERYPASSVAVACGGGAAIGGLISMLGWALDVYAFTDWDRDGVNIKFNASLVVTCLGVAMAIGQIAPKRRGPVRILAGIAIILGLVTLLQHFTGVDLGIETSFFRMQGDVLATSSPGIMGVPASAASASIGTAILLVSYGRALGFASLLGSAVTIIAWLLIAGFFFGAPQLFAFVPFVNIDLQTAFFMLFLGIGATASVPTRGIAEVLSRGGAGGRFFRRLFVPLVLLSIVLGWVRVAGVSSGALDFAFTNAIRSVLELIVLIGALWWAATGISRTEAAKAAERRARSEVDTHRLLNAAQEAERRRIARDLHDSVGQELTALRLLLHNLPGGKDDLNLRFIRQQAARIDDELSMLVWQLRPKVLDTYGLVNALENFSQAWAASNQVKIDFRSSLPNERLPREIETNLYRIVQEALNNIQKHAQAKTVSISFEQCEEVLILSIRDDGVGFSERDAVESPHTTESGGFGLIGMRERATIISGNCEVESSPGKGTRVTVRVPLG